MDFAEQYTDWYYWLMALNSIMNPWIYISLNRDLQLSLYYCCCLCQHVQAPAASSPQDNPTSLHLQLHRPRSLTAASQAQWSVQDKKRAKPFSNGSFLRQPCNVNTMRCRLNTFQL